MSKTQALISHAQRRGLPVALLMKMMNISLDENNAEQWVWTPLPEDHPYRLYGFSGYWDSVHKK